MKRRTGVQLWLCCSEPPLLSRSHTLAWPEPGCGLRSPHPDYLRQLVLKKNGIMSLKKRVVALTQRQMQMIDALNGGAGVKPGKNHSLFTHTIFIPLDSHSAPPFGFYVGQHFQIPESSACNGSSSCLATVTGSEFFWGQTERRAGKQICKK